MVFLPMRVDECTEQNPHVQANVDRMSDELM